MTASLFATDHYPLPSIELAIEDGGLNCGAGLSCAYRNTLSWQSPTAPLPMENNPQVVFERLFRDGSHHSNVRENKFRFAILNRYHVSMLAYFLDRLRSTPRRRRQSPRPLDGAVPGRRASFSPPMLPSQSPAPLR